MNAMCDDDSYDSDDRPKHRRRRRRNSDSSEIDEEEAARRYNMKHNKEETVTNGINHEWLDRLRRKQKNGVT